MPRWSIPRVTGDDLPALRDDMNRSIEDHNLILAELEQLEQQLKGQGGYVAELSSELRMNGNAVTGLPARPKNDSAATSLVFLKSGRLLYTETDAFVTDKTIIGVAAVSPNGLATLAQIQQLLAELVKGLDATAAPPKVADASAIGVFNRHFAREQHTHQGVNLDEIQTITARKMLQGAGAVATNSTSALLELASINSVALLTRLTTTQRDALTPVNGMATYNSTVNHFQGYRGGAWANLDSALGSAASFSVHKNGTDQTTISASTFTKVTWPTEEFDTGNYFASDRFTPLTTGKYLLCCTLHMDSESSALHRLSLYKNGTEFRRVSRNSVVGTLPDSLGLSTIVQANGSTDYFEIFVYHENSVNLTLNGSAALTYFTGAFVGD